jgi:hypothetical protein
MTQDEQKQVDQLRAQLENAKASADQIRAYFLSVVARLTGEIRLYRGIFWCLLAIATVTTILKILEK